MDYSNILKILAAISALIAAGYLIKIVISIRRSKKSDIRFVSQKNNFAGGDIVGGDSTKTNTK